jgi:peptide/nickel transport system permease protein
VLVIPALAVLLIVAAYLKVRGLMSECLFIGCLAWPWTARAVRAQTFSLRSRDFVDLARMSGMKVRDIIFTEIAPNMMSYLLLVFILQFGGAILTAATLDFIGLGPTDGISLGLMMNYAFLDAALMLRIWWWFVPPGLAIMAIVGALYITNVGLDEVFNPKLREM